VQLPAPPTVLIKSKCKWLAACNLQLVWSGRGRIQFFDPTMRLIAQNWRGIFMQMQCGMWQVASESSSCCCCCCCCRWHLYFYGVLLLISIFFTAKRLWSIFHVLGLISSPNHLTINNNTNDNNNINYSCDTFETSLTTMLWTARYETTPRVKAAERSWRGVEYARGRVIGGEDQAKYSLPAALD